MGAPYGVVPEAAQRVLEVVARIPEGKVATYGDVGALVGRGPRWPGNVLGRYGADVPWWRVVRAGGWPPQGHEEVALEHYRAEGTPLVRGTLDGLRVDLARARWEPTDDDARPERPSAGARGSLHHVEVWVGDLTQARRSLGWLLGELGYRCTDRWPQDGSVGESWELGATYVVLEAGADVTGPHDRRRAGVNHLAFHAGSRADVDRLVRAAPAHGWSLMYVDRHPFAGGPGHYAAYLEDAAGFEVELVAG